MLSSTKCFVIIGEDEVHNPNYNFKQYNMFDTKKLVRNKCNKITKIFCDTCLYILSCVNLIYHSHTNCIKWSFPCFTRVSHYLLWRVRKCIPPLCIRMMFCGIVSFLLGIFLSTLWLIMLFVQDIINEKKKKNFLWKQLWFEHQRT